MGIGKGALLMAKQFALQYRVYHACYCFGHRQLLCYKKYVYQSGGGVEAGVVISSL